MDLKGQKTFRSLPRKGTSCPNLTLGLTRVSSDALSGLCVASMWKSILVISRDPERSMSKELDGFFLSLNREIDCICCDLAGVNREAREIIALRHQRMIILPCFAHLSVLDCSDLIKYSSAARVLPDCLHLKNVFNASSSRWLPRLRAAHGSNYWISLCSIIKCHHAVDIDLVVRMLAVAGAEGFQASTLGHT